MPLLRMHAIGDWSPEQVHTTWTASSCAALPPEVEAAIEQAWRDAIARPGIKLFDGPMCRLEKWTADAAQLRLVMSPTSYKVFWGTNLMNPTLADRFGPSTLANPVGLSPALETSDGFLLMGRRNDRVAYYPGRLHPFAGCLEPGDLNSGSAPDVFAGVRRELAEELSLNELDVPLIRCTGIAEDVALRQPELVFRVQSTLACAAIESRLADDEHVASVAIPATKDAVVERLRDPALTPVGVASLLLWGRVRFGQDWFDAQANVWE